MITTIERIHKFALKYNGCQTGDETTTEAKEITGNKRAEEITLLAINESKRLLCWE